VAGVSDDVIEGLRAAIAGSPENHALRIHLAELLLQRGDAVTALEEATMVLDHEPDHGQALRVAARAAAEAGDDRRAAAFDRLAEGLGASDAPDLGESGAEAEAEPEAVVRLHAVRGGKREGAFAEVEGPTLTLADVAGMDHVKRRLKTAFLAPLTNPALRRMYRKSLRGGLLLWGPPGCGKTFIARATAGELGARFIAVGLHDVLDMWLGASEKNLHDLFESARRNAPCVLFFDEADALGRKRSQLQHSAGREVVAQFLAEMDSFQNDNEGLFVLAATNHPWDVDVALRRPGRFDRMVLVLPPDEEAREAILRYHLRGRPIGELELGHLAAQTELFSGADLAHICEVAAEFALEDSIESGTPRPIMMADLERALGEIRPSTVPWLKTARNYAQFAAEGGAYDDLLVYLREHKLT
jgi:SpoVK/Ycf46/Vps4 family AAA+-type ATPase